MRSTAPNLIEEAERAVAAGLLDQAADLFVQAGAGNPGDATVWMRAAALYRASGKSRKALVAVQKALICDPLDFTALLLRASLLESLGDEGAGQAWDNALAQLPMGDLPPQLRDTVAHGQRMRAQWIAKREAAMEEALESIMVEAGEDDRKRISRFLTNVLRKTLPFRSSPTHFHYPGLREREFHPRAVFPWLDELEAATETIAGELQAVMSAERAELVPYIEYADHLPLGQWRPLNRNPDWTAIHLLNRGVSIEANARHCPETMRFLSRLPQPEITGAGPNAMFSLLAPETAIPPHCGVNNTRLVCHLPLIVPPNCWFRVGAETVEWERGKAFVFDDTIEHEAANQSKELRIVFIFDVWHPDLTEIERNAVARLVEADQRVSAPAL